MNIINNNCVDLYVLFEDMARLVCVREIETTVN